MDDFNQNTPNQQPPYQQPPYQAPQQPYQQPYQQPVYVDPTDHTGEFEAQDISDNKVLAMTPYLMGWLGILICLLAINNSKFVAFHVKQALKIEVLSALLLIITLLLVWTIIVPIVAIVCWIILFVVRIICFFQVCGNKAKEPAIVKAFTFLK